MEAFRALHGGVSHTSNEMHKVTDLFFEDMRPFADFPLEKIFTFVDRIPYISDDDLLGPGRHEMTARPKVALKLPGLDCKKKAILIACWARCKKIPYRFIAVGELGAEVSHVFCQVKVSSAWCTMDCTVPGLYTPGAPMPTVTSAFEI